MVTKDLFLTIIYILNIEEVFEQIAPELLSETF